MTNGIPQSSLASTLDLTDAAGRMWDAVVVGGGPAGAVAARQMALAGADVLLVDRAAFPRWKVCGCCLNGAALAALETIGLGDLPDRLGARPLRRFEWHVGRRCAAVLLPTGMALSRWVLDAALVAAAIEAGAAFLAQTTAVLCPPVTDGCRIELTSSQQQAEIRAEVAVAADGLAGRLLHRLPECAPVIHRDARMGAGVLLDDQLDAYRDGTIYMTSGPGGYVGMVRLEDGSLDVGAALDRKAVRDAAGPGPVVARILTHAGLPVPDELEMAPWRGTPPLTRERLHVARHRLFILGDAASYVEPFTGEGIAWAILSAILAAPLAVEGARAWSPDISRRWAQLYRRWIGRRQTTCRLVARLLRVPVAVQTAATALGWAPWLASPVLRTMNRLPPEMPIHQLQEAT